MGRTGAGAVRERAVLAAGLVSTAALAWAALAPWGDPELAGQMELERRGQQATELVQLGWDRVLRGEVALAGEIVGWRAEDLARPAGAPRRDRYRPSGGLVPFDVLLAEAETSTGLPAQALAQLEEALALHPQAALRPEGLLRAIQLAVGAGDGAGAARHLDAALEELAPGDARGDTSYRLLCALAAAPLLDPARRAVLQRALADAWRAGTLALPDPRDGWVPEGDAWRYRPYPRLELLARRLGALAAEEPGEPIGLPGRKARALVRLAGEPDPPDGGRWQATAFAGGILLARRRGTELEGLLADSRSLARALAESLELAPGFQVVLADDVPPGKTPGEPVGEPIQLAGGLRVAVHHDDPRALVRAEAGRLRLLRTAFAVLAALSAAASLVTFRALRRERRLASLKSGFIAGVSHDLRTPLASILLMAENLEEGRVAGEGARGRYYASIRREASRLRRLVDDVLDFSRIERGEGTRLTVEEVDLPRLVGELEAEAGERVERAGGTLTVERGDLPPSAALDAEAVRRSVWNLVDNALAHSGSTDVHLASRLEDDRWLVLEVADRGRGIPPERREEVFRPFAQLGPDGSAGGSIGGSAGGTGLGLAIVREVARAHGGDATATAGSDGEGTLVRMRLDLIHDTP